MLTDLQMARDLLVRHTDTYKMDNFLFPGSQFTESFFINLDFVLFVECQCQVVGRHQEEYDIKTGHDQIGKLVEIGGFRIGREGFDIMK